MLLHFLFSQGRIAVAGLVSVPSRCINIVILIIIITIIIIVVVLVFLRPDGRVVVLVFLRPDGRVVVEAVVDAAPVATRR